MDNQLITIRLSKDECRSLEILLERMRDNYARARKVQGCWPGLTAYYEELPVFSDEFEAVEVLDNVLRQFIGLKPY